MMAAARFCSECAARIKVRRTSILPFRSFCSACSPRYHRIRLILVLVPILSAGIGFAIGHYTSTPEPFYVIGTPVDLVSNGTSSSGDIHRSAVGSSSVSHSQEAVIPTSTPGTTCGARTKSGKPCRRKVKGGGPCWQHRDTHTN
jgi:hypothetical protein